MAALIDINVLVALMHERHEHSIIAAGWLNGKAAAKSVKLCRIAQMGALRILTDQKIMDKDILSPAQFWKYWTTLLSDKGFSKYEGLELKILNIAK